MTTARRRADVARRRDRRPAVRIAGLAALTPAMPSTAVEPADDVLVARILARDEDAFVALVARYQKSLLRLARTFVRDDSLAEDVVQDTWMGLVRGLERFEGRSSVKTWLFTILSNRARTRAVREARYVPIGTDDDGNEHGSAAAGNGANGERIELTRFTPERTLLSAEVRRYIEEALATLPLAQRAVVDLRDIQQLDTRDVCNILGVTETNQRVLLHRGRTKVRAILAARLEL